MHWSNEDNFTGSNRFTQWFSSPWSRGKEFHNVGKGLHALHNHIIYPQYTQVKKTILKLNVYYVPF